MKPILIFTFVISSKTLFGQENKPVRDTAHFPGGHSVVYCSYSGIETPPKHMIAISPITATFVGWTNPVSFGISGNYMLRINDRLLFDAKGFVPYSNKTDAAIFSEELQQSTLEFGANISYKFAQRVKYHKNHFYIDSKGSSRPGYTVDMLGIEIKMPYVTNYYVTGGLNYLQAATSDEIGIVDTANYTRMTVSNLYSGTINLGITRDRYTYHIYNSEKLKKVSYRYYRVRNFLYFTYSPYTNYNVIGEEKYDVNDPNSGQEKIVTSGYDKPSVFRRLGWRFGAELKMTSHGGHNLPYFGIEMGRIYGLHVNPYENSYYNKSTNGYWSGSCYVVMKMGFEIGTKNHTTASALTKF